MQQCFHAKGLFEYSISQDYIAKEEWNDAVLHVLISHRSGEQMEY